MASVRSDWIHRNLRGAFPRRVGSFRGGTVQQIRGRWPEGEKGHEETAREGCGSQSEMHRDDDPVEAAGDREGAEAHLRDEESHTGEGEGHEAEVRTEPEDR